MSGPIRECPMCRRYHPGPCSNAEIGRTPLLAEDAGGREPGEWCKCDEPGYLDAGGTCPRCGRVKDVLGEALTWAIVEARRGQRRMKHTRGADTFERRARTLSELREALEHPFLRLTSIANRIESIGEPRWSGIGDAARHAGALRRLAALLERTAE